MAITSKQTIYIDSDDEITAIIEKVKNCPEKIVALVLPKRAPVLQSIVNMKLLKKSAQAAKKNLVLVTSESGLLPLAGAVGLHVAKTLQTKPMIPLAPHRDDDEQEEVVEASPSSDKEDIDTDVPAAAVSTVPKSQAKTVDEDLETIELDDEAAELPAEGAKKPKSKLAKRFKVPNFDRFRLSFFLGILAVILLVVGWVFAAIVLPKAVITISTDTTTNVSNISFTANTALKDLDIEKGLVPAVQKEVKKTDTEKTTATGKKDNGAKATGTITVRNCDYSDGFSIPAGSSFTSQGKIFVSNEGATVPKFTGPSSSCSLSGSSSGKVNIEVTASAGGEGYNISSGSYTVPGIPDSAKVDAIGSAMTGGTTSVIKVVAQSDVDAAVDKMKGRQDAAAKTELAGLIRTDNLKSFDETLVIGAPAITSVPAVGAEASGDVIVTSVTTYSILAARADYLSQLIKKDATTKIDTTKQAILDDGLGSAVIRVTAAKSPTESTMSLQTLVVAGAQLNADQIKDEIKGLKRGEVERIIKGKTGVKDVTVSYKPFWVLSTPKSVKKITITIEKPVVNTVAPTNSSNP